MELFRIARREYAGQLTPSGYAARWNLNGEQVIYAGSTRALSTLELVVHKRDMNPHDHYRVMVISISEEDGLTRQIRTGELPVNWRTLAAYSMLQRIGSEWYKKQESLLLKVPSVIIPYEYNFVINTKHPDYSRSVSLVRTEAYFWDTRLFKN